MTVAEFLKQATAQLQKAGIATARLDSLILLEDALHQDRALLLAHGDYDIPVPIHAQLYKKIIQREKHLPLAYIRGSAAFYGRNFMVNSSVLVPRPETETMIELVRSLPHLAPGARIWDIGTGSGCIGITISLELNANVTLSDIDSQALLVAQQNAKSLNAPVSIVQQDLLDDTTMAADILLANLPYVPQDYAINMAASHEPPLALFAGDDGLDEYRRFWQQITHLVTPPQYVLTESLRTQQAPIVQLAQEAGYTLLQQKGLIQVFTARRQS